LPACLLACLPACLLACLPACLLACLSNCLMFLYWSLYYHVMVQILLFVMVCLLFHRSKVSGWTRNNYRIYNAKISSNGFWIEMSFWIRYKDTKLFSARPEEWFCLCDTRISNSTKRHCIKCCSIEVGTLLCSQIFRRGLGPTFYQTTYFVLLMYLNIKINLYYSLYSKTILPAFSKVYAATRWQSRREWGNGLPSIKQRFYLDKLISIQSLLKFFICNTLLIKIIWRQFFWIKLSECWDRVWLTAVHRNFQIVNFVCVWLRSLKRSFEMYAYLFHI